MSLEAGHPGAEIGAPASGQAVNTPPRREVIYRHTVVVRLTHWLNALAIVVLIGSGLNIFNAHPRLYWGQTGSEFQQPFLSVGAVDAAGGARGVTTIGPLRFDTTGVLGVSRDHGQEIQKAWPSWLTIPSFRDLADARHWHFLFAWVLAVNALVYLLWSLLVRHLQRDLWPTVADLKSIPRSVADHLRFRHSNGEAAKRYNVLQRLAYLGVITLVILMVLTGLTMSPGFDAFAPWLLDLFGGRQSARTIHFLCASGIAAFLIVHLVEVVLAGPINEVRSMITGRYAVPQDHTRRGPP
jgi:thiosulfate reductase cytochrome b subunit